LPAISNSLNDSVNDSATKSVLKSPPATIEATKSISGGKRRTAKEINYKEDSGNTTSSVEYPVEGKHTDDESEGGKSESGNRTPVFFNPPQQGTLPNFMTEPAATMQLSGGPLNFPTRNQSPEENLQNISGDLLLLKTPSPRQLEKRKD